MVSAVSLLHISVILLQNLTVVDAISLRGKWTLNWLRQAEIQHTNSQEDKKSEQRVDLLSKVFEGLNQLGDIGTPCNTCKLSLRVLKDSLEGDNTPLGAFFYGVCSKQTGVTNMFKHICDNLHLYKSDTAENGFSFLPDFANALSDLDPEGIDGDYLCHYMFSNACPRPPTPLIDYNLYWPPKPIISPKVERSNVTFNVLHLSDVHLSSNYTEHAAANCLGAMCCDSYAYQNPFERVIPAPKYGHWRCDCPQSLLESAVNDASIRDDIDYKFAIFTGDMVDHNPVLISKEETILEEKRTLLALKKFLKGIPVFPVLGNHDSYPYSQEPPQTSRYADRTSFNIDLMQHMWSEFGWIPRKSAAQMKATHGAYTVEPIPGLKIITLNSNYWYRWNFYNYVDMENPDPSGIIRFLIAELLDCEWTGKKAWVQAHVPPGGLPDEALPPAASFLAATLERFNDVISGQFFGHTHLDEFSVLYSNNATQKTEENALNVAWIAPSITPFTYLNPGWRYYQVDTATFEIMDSISVFADIEPTFGLSWDKTPDLNWELLYSARDEYGGIVAWPKTEPLNGRFWHRVAHEILYNPDFSEDFVRRSYRNSSQAPECSDYDCRSERYCYSTSMTPDQVAKCHEVYNSGDRWKAGKLRLGNEYHCKSHSSKNCRRPYHQPFHGIPSFPMPRPIRHKKFGNQI